MALKKSELYSSLWQSCDALRGGMDASQYKDYVLVLLFLKYISDKYAGRPFAPVKVPAGAGFADMIALKGKSTIGDDINKKIIGPLTSANPQLSQADFPDFNDPVKLGDGKEMVERLTNLVAIFENPALDFSRNRAEGDDILGDAYEYLMRHFATESGKSKGQFYTPAEVSRIIAHVLGIRHAETSAQTTVYDPTCGSGSLLLKVADAARTPVTLYGQEKDAATSGLARMNMILHNNPTAAVVQGNTLTDPKFSESGLLKTFDYVVANPPFSDKRWSTGLDPANDEHERFKPFGIPPAKQGDYAYLLHIGRSVKSTGRGACILPHGVLFRGNAEAEIRRNLVRRGYILGIIGLPPNLFYGTGIPACILVIDKRDAHRRAAQGTGIFMIDASAGFAKDGPKNRLREQDIHRIVDTFARGADVPKYARLVSLAEIEANDFNLNLPRYIDTTQAEDIQDIDAHLRGGIPVRDIDALDTYWRAFPALRAALFTPLRPGYSQLAIRNSPLKQSIFQHPQFTAYTEQMAAHFNAWRQPTVATLKALQPGFQPKQLIAELSEGLLAHYSDRPLIDPYTIYQHLMDYWAETMQDDAYLIAAPVEEGGGWQAETSRIIETDSRGRQRDKGWVCDLLPKPLIVARYFAQEQTELERMEVETQNFASLQAELEEEQSGEEGAFAELDKINKSEVSRRRKEIGNDPDAAEEAAHLESWLALYEQQADLKKAIRDADAALDALAYHKYPTLTPDEIRTLVVDDKWLAALDAAIRGEIDRISQALARRIQELAERYADPLPALTAQAEAVESRVAGHLERMGFVWQ
jgi:type I restriction enzyme M protein